MDRQTITTRTHVRTGFSADKNTIRWPCISIYVSCFAHLASKRRPSTAGLVSFDDTPDTTIHASDADESARANSQDSNARLYGLALPRAEPAAVDPAIVQEEGARDAVRVPRGEQARGDADQVVEDGHAHGEHKRRHVDQQHQGQPCRPPEHRMRVHVV